MNKASKIIIALFLPFLAGSIGSLATAPSIPTWYASLNKPSFSPPNWVFGPAWTTLYLLMGISFYRAWTAKPAPENSNAQKRTLALFLIHLALNALWSVAFFGWRSPALGLAVITALIITLLIIIKRFFSLDKPAAYLLIPYLAWISFAALLNFSIWYLN